MSMDTFGEIENWLEACKAEGLTVVAHRMSHDSSIHAYSAACENDAGEVVAVWLSYYDPLIPDYGLILHPQEKTA